MSKTSHRALRNVLIALVAGVLGSSLASAQSGGPISAYRDSSGRVIFVNEPPLELSTPPAPESKPGSNPADSAGSTQPTPPQQKEPAPSMSTLQSAWDDVIEGTAQRHHLDPDLIRAIVRVESNFNPYAVSSRGAQGLMQLIPATARRFGVSNLFDPRANLDGGVRYLKYLMNLFGGDLKLSLAAYNAGENAVDRHNGVPPFPETQDYLRKISRIYPLSSAKRESSQGIGKYVDSNGIVHFSNTDLP